MKRVGNLFESICDFGNLYNAFKKARKGKLKRREVHHFFMNIENELLELQEELKSLSYKQGEFRTHYIFTPKYREIKALPFRDRVVQHAINNYIEPIFENAFIEHSYACRKGKGNHAASTTLKNWLHAAKIQGKTMYVLKCDVRKYFDSIDIKTLYKIIKRKIKDKALLTIIREILEIDKKTKGVPIGNLTSQLFANVYLNELDKFVKEELKVEYYARYMDDFVILSEDKFELKIILEKIIDFLDKALKLKLNDKTRIYKAKSGVDFVGYVHFADHIRVRKSTWKRGKQRIAETIYNYEIGFINSDKVRNVIASIHGCSKHADTYTILNKQSEIYNNKMKRVNINQVFESFGSYECYRYDVTLNRNIINV